MARPSHFQALTSQFSEQYGSRSLSTQRGSPTQYPKRISGMRVRGDLVQALRPLWSINFQVPSRQTRIAYLVQEIYSVCPSVARGLQELAADATTDEQADTQPDAFLVYGEPDARQRKIKGILRRGFDRLQVGPDGPMRMRTGLKYGNCFAEPVFERDKGGPWKFNHLNYLPTFEVFKDPHTNTYEQKRKGSMGGGLIAKWEVPDWLANLTIEEDSASPYGVSILQHIIPDYRYFISALEDAAAAAKTRAPQRIAHYYGNEKGFAPVGPDELDAYIERNKIDPTTVTTDYWLRSGWEKVEEIGGDAAGVGALADMVDRHMDRMKYALGVREDSSQVSGRGLEGIDARYAAHINALRLADWKFKKNVGDKLLLLEGMKEVAWSTRIPPLGETPSNRTTRASNEFMRGFSGMEGYCATIGLKDPDEVWADIKETKAQFEELGIEWPPKSPPSAQQRSARQDVVGTDSPSSGADPQKSRGRREQQRRSGKTPTGA